MLSICGSRYRVSRWLVISRKLIPRSSIREPSGTEKSAVTRIRTSCRRSLCGRKATSSLGAKPVSSCNSVAAATLVETFSGRKIVERCRSSAGTCDTMPGFHGPASDCDGASVAEMRVSTTLMRNLRQRAACCCQCAHAPQHNARHHGHQKREATMTIKPDEIRYLGNYRPDDCEILAGQSAIDLAWGASVTRVSSAVRGPPRRSEGDISRRESPRPG